MTDAVLPLFECCACGLKLYTWWAAGRARWDGCPECRLIRDIKAAEAEGGGQRAGFTSDQFRSRTERLPGDPRHDQ